MTLNRRALTLHFITTSPRFLSAAILLALLAVNFAAKLHLWHSACTISVMSQWTSQHIYYSVQSFATYRVTLYFVKSVNPQSVSSHESLRNCGTSRMSVVVRAKESDQIALPVPVASMSPITTSTCGARRDPSTTATHATPSSRSCVSVTLPPSATGEVTPRVEMAAMYTFFTGTVPTQHYGLIHCCF